MPTDLIKTLELLKGVWMIGGSATEKAPSSWRAIVEADPSPDSAMIVLAGQAMQFALRPTPGGQLAPLPMLPKLSLPTLSSQARLQFQNLVRVVRLSESQTQAVVQLLANRGFVFHPTDYSPRNFEALPEVYTPWVSWYQREKSRASDASAKYETLDADNWDHWMPAERRAALSLLRRGQPEVARELIADKTPTLSADERTRIIELLGENLSSDDQSLLEGFASDRSGRVRSLVEQYLARIGAVEDVAEDVAEYVDFFAVSKKLLRGGYKVTTKPTKTKAQRKRRSELAAKLSLRGFVKGLGLNKEEELIQGWEHSDHEASEALVQMVVTTGSEQAVAALATRITSLEGISGEALQQLFDRMGKESRRELLPRVLENSDASLSAALVCGQGLWGEISLRQIESLRAFKELRKLAGEGDSNHQRQMTLRAGLFALGLLADQAAASALIKRFTDSGLFVSDPMLGLLKLNACLPLGEPE